MPRAGLIPSYSFHVCAVPGADLRLGLHSFPVGCSFKRLGELHGREVV